MESKQILKNLSAVLIYARERFNNEFVNQEVKLNNDFKSLFTEYMKSKDKEIKFYEHTAIVSNREGQKIYIANQWFAIASYFVDFCTELLTYQEYFVKISKSIGILKQKDRNDYAKTLKSLPSSEDKIRFKSAAINILIEEYPSSSDHDRIAEYIWKFVSDYSWWAGSKTVDRHDFHISPILNQLNVVNANAEFLADIVLSYSSDYSLRCMVEKLEDFTVGIIKNDYSPSDREIESYVKAEDTLISDSNKFSMGISISAASLERFKTSVR